MWFWWFILICDCIIPAIMIIAGRMMWKHCPKKINGVVGYQTKMSMINMDTWRFAHDHAGKLWWKVGIGLLGPTMLIHIPICITKISTFLILCDLAVCLATLYVSFSLVFALMRYLQGKVFLIRFYSPTTLSSSRAEFRLPSRLACA